jgi:transposase
MDAENLARLARLDPKLLYPLKLRSQECQAHMALIRSREALVSSRTQLVNHVPKERSNRWAQGCPSALPGASTREGPRAHPRGEHIPEALSPALGPILEQIGSLTERIREYDRELETLCEAHYPETQLLRQVEGTQGRSRRSPSCSP